MKSLLLSVFLVNLLLLCSCKKETTSPNPVNNTSTAGKHLLFDENVSYNAGTFTGTDALTNLYSSNLAGTGLTQLTTPPANYFDYRASFSFDGSKVLFVRGDVVSEADKMLWYINSDGSNETEITSGSGVDFPSFSPSGTQVAYGKNLVGDQNPQYQIYISNLDGSGEKQITTFTQTGDAEDIHWAKNGTIFFMVGGTIFSIAADGSNQKLVVNSGDLLGISPDSNFILYQTSSGLVYCNIDGTNPKTILSFSTGQWTLQNGGGWSDDSKEVFFYNNASTVPASGVYSINIDGSDLTKVLSGYYEYPSVF